MTAQFIPTQLISPQPVQIPTQPVSTGSITDRALLLILNISTWSPRKLDKQVTREVAQSKGVTGNPEKAGRYTKNLIPNSDTLNAVQTIVSQARAEFYARTRPWSQDGSRIISADAYIELIARLNTLELDFKHAVKQFILAYPNLKASAKTTLGSLFNDSDYPDVATLENKFAWRVVPLPLPTGDDFRVNLGDELTAQMRLDIEAELRGGIQAAMQDNWEQLGKKLGYVVERLADPEAVFQERLLTSLKDLADTTRKLNFTNDNTLERVIQDLEQSVLTHSSESLRTNATTRATVAADAKAIHARMAAFMGKSEQEQS